MGRARQYLVQRHLQWLAKVRFHDSLVQTVFAEHLACHEVLLARRDRLDQLLGEQTQSDRWAPLIGRLRCLRGVDTLTAVGLLVEIRDFTAFTHPRQLSSYLGLVPGESSTGERRRQGSITTAGSPTPADC